MKTSLFFTRTVSLTFLSIFVFAFFANDSFAAQNRRSSLRTFGDYIQIINPIFAAGFASQEKGFGHFAIIYSQTFAIMYGTKLIAKSGKWRISKRPYIENKKDRYEGFPSGHTASAFAAASYVRTFSDEHKLLSIPLYITAAVTGYSRVKAKEHTGLQVVAGAALAEIVTFVNSKLDWSNEYRSTSFQVFPNGGTISFEFKF
jgi:lipid A 4'-phosphatase